MSQKKSFKVDLTEVVPMFPSLVWKVQLSRDTYEPLNRGLKSKIFELTRLNKGLPDSSKLQTEQTLHQLSEFKAFNDIIDHASKGFLEFLKINYQTFEITGCWANISPPGDGHKPHTHPNNYLSGVYYLQTQSGADRISFNDPRPQTNIISPPTIEATDMNAGQIHINAKEGLMVLFPSWLEHQVPPNQSSEPRISIAFNLMFSQFDKTMSSPKWQGNVGVK